MVDQFDDIASVQKIVDEGRGYSAGHGILVIQAVVLAPELLLDQGANCAHVRASLHFWLE